MRVLVISQHFWPESFRINGFVEDLRDAGVEVCVLTGQPNYPAGKTFPGYRWYRAASERHPSGYDICRVPLIPRGHGGHVRLALNYLSFILSGIIWGTWLLRRRRFDILFVYGTSPILQGFVGAWLRPVKRAKLVLWVQDIWPDVLAASGYVRRPFLLKLVGRLVGLLYRRADLILSQSAAFVPSIEKMSGRVPVQYFPNPGEREGLAEPAAAPVTLPAKFNIVFAGNLGTAQALDAIVEAADLLRGNEDIHFTLFGSGSMDQWLAAEVAARRLPNLSLGGRLAPEAMPAVYRQASALLLTLIDDEMVARTVPSKLQSYLRAGVPIIAAAGFEVARIVEEAGAGIVCAPQDAAALAKAAVAMESASEEDRRRMGQSAQAYYQANFDAGFLARDLAARFDALMIWEKKS